MASTDGPFLPCGSPYSALDRSQFVTPWHKRRTASDLRHDVYIHYGMDFTANSYAYGGSIMLAPISAKVAFVTSL